jgi:hypothetical protein
MTAAACILLMSLSAWSPAFYGPIDAQAPTYRVSLPDGGQAVIGFYAKGKFVDLSTLTGTNVNYYVDAPWQYLHTGLPPNPKSLIRTSLSPSKESPSVRNQRLEQGWKTAGYVFVETPQGQHPVLKQEFELAQRAAAMARAVEAQATATPAALPQAAAAPPPELGLWQQWGMHLVIAVVGLSLTALVIKTLVLE